MSKFVGVKMIEAVPMTAGEAKAKGYKISNHALDVKGYEVTYPDGYKSWSPARVFDAFYFRLENPDGDKLTKDDIKRFIVKEEAIKVGTKTTNLCLTLANQFEVHGQASCINADNYNVELGKEFARPEAEDKVWELLGFVVQWARCGVRLITPVEDEPKPAAIKIYPDHVQRMINEYHELLNRCVKLKNFINDNSIYKGLGSDEQDDMIDQMRAMDNYLIALEKRLKRAGFQFDVNPA